MVDQDPETTDDHMTSDTTHAVGTATVPPAHDPEHHRAPTPPPGVDARIDEVLTWISTVAVTAGIPDNIDISMTTAKISVDVPTQTFFTQWMTSIGATLRPPRVDALGTVIRGTTNRSDQWAVTVRAHVAHDRGTR